MKSIRLILLCIILCVTAYTAVFIYQVESRKRVLKVDLIELSNIKYGLFSVDEWKVIIANILSKKLEEFNFTPDQRAEARIKIEEFLSQTITEFESSYYDENSNDLLGIAKGIGAKLFGIFDKMKRDVPGFTDKILDFLSDSENRDNVKVFIMDKLGEYADKTFAQIDYTEQNRILDAYHFGDRYQTIRGLNNELAQSEKKEWLYIAMIFPMVLLTCLMMAFTKTPSKSEYVFYAAISIVLLVGGLLLPMIEIDARIERMTFTLLGEPIAFYDQVLYYKSKSILEVVWLMLTQDLWKVYMVGILVLTFSVLFPLCKIFSSLVYIFSESSRSGKFIRFLVFKTGKWSMADVMVVAIFMAYIGFTGILTEQLNQLENLSQKLDILTTNKSALQMGFFLFTSFVIVSLLLSHRLQYQKTI